MNNCRFGFLSTTKYDENTDKGGNVKSSAFLPSQLRRKINVLSIDNDDEMGDF